MSMQTRRSLMLATAAGLAFAATSAAAEPVNLGVSIPAATHSFMGGINYWANQAKKDLEAKHKDLKITIRTAPVLQCSLCSRGAPGSWCRGHASRNEEASEKWSHTTRIGADLLLSMTTYLHR